MSKIPFRCGTVEAYLAIGMVEAGEETKRRLSDIVNAPEETEVQPA